MQLMNLHMQILVELILTLKHDRRRKHNWIKMMRILQKKFNIFSHVKGHVKLIDECNSSRKSPYQSTKKALVIYDPGRFRFRMVPDQHGLMSNAEQCRSQFIIWCFIKEEREAWHVRQNKIVFMFHFTLALKTCMHMFHP